MAGRDSAARRANRSASMTLSPDEAKRTGVVPGAASASAIRAMDEPMTRAIWTAVSVSARPSATMCWKSAHRLEVHVGEGRVVVVHVEEPERPPEPPGVVGRQVGELGDLGLGQPPAGRDEQAVDHEQVDHVVLDGLVDLLVRAAEPEEHGAYPDQRLDPLGVELGLGLGLGLGVGVGVLDVAMSGRVVRGRAGRTIDCLGSDGARIIPSGIGLRRARRRRRGGTDTLRHRG